MNRKLELTLLILLILAIIGPMFYYGFPFYESSPDMAYVKAKVLQVLTGNIFTDPISGYDTLHPPMYHILIAPLKAIGLSFRVILILVSIFTVTLTIVFAYKVLVILFDRPTALLTCLLILFINYFMGCRGILLASSFYFSVPFYLAGLWLYLISEKFLKLTIISSLLWGITFFVSSV